MGNKLKHFLSLEDYLSENGEFTSFVNCRDVNESLDTFSKDIDKIIRIHNQNILVINDIAFAEEMSKHNKFVLCIYFDNSIKVSDKSKFRYVKLKNKGKRINESTKEELNIIFDEFKSIEFDFVFNISPDTFDKLNYEVITDLNLYIFDKTFIPGITAYYSFDELDVFDKFDKELYNNYKLKVRQKKRIDFSEWNRVYGFEKKNEIDRFLNVVYIDENDVFFKEDLDKSDYSGATENLDDEHILKYAIEPIIYSFQTDYINSTLGINALKVGDTDRGLETRLSEWGKVYPDYNNEKNKEYINSWSSVISGLGEGLDGKVFRDKTIHKILTNYYNIRNVGTDDEKDTLRRKGIYFSNEFFENCTKDDVENAIKYLYKLLSENRLDVVSKLKDKSKKTYKFIYPLHKKYLPYSARKLQQDVIDNFIDRYEHNCKKMLIYAVMRFGKTFVACECVKEFCKREGNGKFILIVSSKTEVKNEWLGSVNPYKNYENIDMYTSVNGEGGIYKMLKDKREWIHAEYEKDSDGNLILDSDGNKIIIEEKSIRGPHPGKSYDNLLEYFRDFPNKNIMLFASLQDLDGNNQNFAKKEDVDDMEYVKSQHKCFYEYPIDMIIMDEAHTGTQADSFGYLIGEGDKADEKKLKKIKKEEDIDGDITKKTYNIIMKQLKIDKAIKLYLSGTPYNLLYNEKFDKNEIIAKFSFADLMREKDKWIEDNHDKLVSKDIDYSNNPYYGIPEMLNFGYKFDSFKLNEMKKRGVEYNFKTLFKTNKNEFVFENDILNLFKAIDGTDKTEGVLDLLNLKEIRKGNMCKHIIIVLPYRTTCDVMENFLKKYKKELKNLGEYQVINISGNSVTYDSDFAKQIIYDEDRHGNKTISLTVNKLLTGVTVKPWDTMFYMKDGMSAQSYDQAKFRIQTPYIKEIPELEIGDDMKSVGIVKDSEGNVVKQKIDMKPQTIFVDFSADRIFALLHKRYNAELDSRGITTETDSYEDEYEKLAERDLKYLPIVTSETGKLKKLESTNIVDIIRSSLAAIYFSKDINEMISGIKFPEADDKDEENLKWFPEVFDDKKKGKKKIDIPGVEGDADDFDSSDYEDETVDGGELVKKEHKSYTRLTPEERKERMRHIIKKSQTIMMNFAIYLLTRKDDVNIISWKKLFGDSMRNVANKKDDESGETIDRDGINVDIIINIFGDGIIPEDFNERQKKVKKIKDELKLWVHRYLTKMPGLRNEVLNRLIAMIGKYGDRSDFTKIKDNLKSFSNLGKTEFITPYSLSKKLFENVVIFNKDSKILDCYGSKIGEILNYLLTDEKFAKDFNLSNYYLIAKNSRIAELCKVTFNIAYKKQHAWNISHKKESNKKPFKYISDNGEEILMNTLDARQKDKFFNDHILIFNTEKEEEKEKEIEEIKSEEPIITDEESETRGLWGGYTREESEPAIEESKKPRRSKEEIERSKRKNTYLVDLEDAIKNKWGENMKFDIIVGNPPYDGSLHLKIINSAMEFMKEDGVGCFIHPARWFEDPLVNVKNEGKGRKPDKIIFKNVTDNIYNADFIDVFNANKKFNIQYSSDLMISYIKKHNNKKFELYNNEFNNNIKVILNYTLNNNLNNVIDENSIDGWRVLIKRVLPSKNEHGRMDKYARINAFKVVPDISVFFNGKTKDGLDWTETFNSGDKKKEKGTYMQKSISFKNENEAYNFEKSCHTNFFMNCIYLFRFGIDAPLAYLPWMEDYSHAWTDEDYCEFFGKLGMSKECQEWMCRSVDDYRVKDFIDYIHFDDEED